jgi:hypothetical protein
MTSVLSCLVASIALAADPSPKGLPLGIPPAADDAVITRVAPPHCLFYVNWAGTAVPDASSGSETEKLLAEPEVQELLGSVNRLIVGALRSQDDAAKKPATTVTVYRTPVPPSQLDSAPPAIQDKVKTKLEPAKPAAFVGAPTDAAPDTLASKLASSQTSCPEACPPPTTDKAAIPPQPLPIAAPAKLSFSISAEDYGDWIDVLLTHPTAIFIEDVKITPPQTAEKRSDAKKAEMKKPGGKNPMGENPAAAETPQVIFEAGLACPFVPANLHGGMVVSLGSDSARLHAKFIKYLRKAKKAGLDSDFELVQIAGQTWYRTKPYKLDFASDKVVVTFGFHGRYFVVGIGDGAIEGILARWNRAAPAWLATALEETPVPRRTGIIYANLKSLRETLLPLVAQTNIPAELEMLGLANVDSLVSTTGLEDRGIINRVLLTIDGKPSGLLDMVAERPLSAKDLEPIPADALMAFAARVDVKRTIDMLISAYEKSAAASDADARSGVPEMKKDYVEVQRMLAAVGDTWCIYNSPTEGEVPFLGWTIVVPIRDRAALVDGWSKLIAAQKKNGSDDAAKVETPGTLELFGPNAEYRKCSFAGHEIYYMASQAIAPAVCILDHEMVMTLNMPAMKAYLTRKDHHSLAAEPDVKRALNDRNRPACLWYCDTPKLFDFCYPLVSFYASVGAAAAHQANIDLDPTFWPSAPVIRAHLRPDIATIQRTAHGLQLTCRYCLPSGGATGPLCLVGMQMLGVWTTSCPVAGPSVTPASSGSPYSTPQDGTCEATVVEAECSPPTPYCVPVAPSLYVCQPSSTPAQPAAQTASARTAPLCPIPTGYPAVSYPAGMTYPATPYNCAPTPYPVPSTVAVPGPVLGYVAPATPYSASSTTSPYSAAPAASPYLYGSFNSGQSPVNGGVAKNPTFGAALTVADVIAMTRAKVANELIISQFRNHGLAAPLRPADVITLSQSGVSAEVISALQTAVAKEEFNDRSPHSASPSVLSSSYETPPPPAASPAQAPAKPVEQSPLPRAGSIPAASSDCPKRRVQELIYTSENLRLLQDESERSRMLKEPGNATPSVKFGTAPKAPCATPSSK